MYGVPEVYIEGGHDIRIPCQLPLVVVVAPSRSHCKQYKRIPTHLTYWFDRQTTPRPYPLVPSDA